MIDSNSLIQGTPRKGPSILRLVGLCFLLVAVTLTVWLLSNSNLATSPNQVLAILNTNLNICTAKVLSEVNSLWRHNTVLAPAENRPRPTTFHRADSPAAITNSQRISTFSKVCQGGLPAKKNIEKSSTRLQANKRLTSTEATILARAEALRQAGRLRAATQEYVKLIGLNPNLAIAHQRLGLAAVTDNNLALAVNELERAARLDKHDADTQNDLGLVYEQMGDYRLAKQSFANAHKIDPKNLSAAVNLANAIANGGHYKTSIGIMRKAVADHSQSPLAHNNLASLLARTNDQSGAAKEFAKAIHLDPNLGSAHYGLGIALLKLKSYLPAIREFRTTVTLNPGILDLQNKIDLANRCHLRTMSYTADNYN